MQGMDMIYAALFSRMSCDSNVLHTLTTALFMTSASRVRKFNFDFNIFYPVLLIILSLSEKVSIVE